MSGYPLLLEGTRVDALVVGGGPVALRKVLALLDCGARIRVVAPIVSDRLRQLAAEHPDLHLVSRAYEGTDIGDATLVIAATDARAVNAQVALDATRARRLVNVADAPDEGNCATVAVHRAGTLVIGVSAGGVPAAAARIRDAIGERFDGRFGAAVAALGALRRRLLTGGDAAAWHAVEREMVDARFCARVESGDLATGLAAPPRDTTTSPEHASCR